MIIFFLGSYLAILLLIYKRNRKAKNKSEAEGISYTNNKSKYEEIAFKGVVIRLAILFALLYVLAVYIGFYKFIFLIILLAVITLSSFALPIFGPIDLVIIAIGVFIVEFIFGFPGRHELINSTAAESPEKEANDYLVGQRGVSKTPLKPQGKALISDVEYNVKSELGFIEKDTKIEVIKVSRNNIIVRAV